MTLEMRRRSAMVVTLSCVLCRRVASLVACRSPVSITTPFGAARQCRGVKRGLAMGISNQPFSPPPSEVEAPGEWQTLGMLTEVHDAVVSLGFDNPSPIQRIAIPQVMSGGNLVVAAATGSGKTLAYLLPVINSLKGQEQVEKGLVRSAGRPRALVLVPTRELASQVLDVTKKLSHTAKVSSCGVFGGEDYGVQKRDLSSIVDIVVGSPGRLVKHRDKGSLHLSQVTHVVIDEVDTMLTQGFGTDIMALIRPMIKLAAEGRRSPVQFVLVSATITTALKKLLKEGEFPKIRMVETRDVHRPLPSLQHTMIDCKGRDKLSLLVDILRQYSRVDKRTLVFCNTVASARATQHSLREAGIDSIAYHGEVPSEGRATALADLMAEGGPKHMVCTDIAARGLDMPDINHVVMFDFPLNPIDYLHRSGRTARMGAKGRVTSLVAKRDQVLAAAIERAVTTGAQLDTLSSRRSDYEPGGKLAVAGRGARAGSPAKPRTNHHAAKRTTSSSSRTTGGREGARSRSVEGGPPLRGGGGRGQAPAKRKVVDTTGRSRLR